MPSAVETGGRFTVSWSLEPCLFDVFLADRVRELFGGCGLEPGEPIHRNDLDPVPSRQTLGRPASQDLKTCFERPSIMSSNRAGPVLSRTGVRSMITVTYLSPRRVCRQACNADHGHTVEPARVLDQHPLALGTDRAVCGVPGHAQAFRDTGDGEVLAHDALQHPAQPTTGDLRPGLRGFGDVLPPHATAPGALPIAMVTLCGTATIGVLPLLMQPLSLSAVSFGQWVGLSVHDVGQVVATAQTAGTAALGAAVIIKLTRVLLLTPIVAGAVLFRKESWERGRTRLPAILPLFIIGFLLMIAVRSLGWASPETLEIAAHAQDILIGMALFGLGSAVRVRELIISGGRITIVALLSWILIGALGLLAISLIPK